MLIDLNADLGEGFGAWWRPEDDLALIEVITSANVACGFHAGDPTIMRSTVAACVAAGVAVGAHPAYPDMRGFGRVPFSIPHERIVDDIVYQVGALEGLARLAGGSVAHVKPHGALYEAVAVDPTLALTIADAISALGTMPVLVVPAGSAAALALGAHGWRFRGEGFADRAYQDDGLLAPRNRPGAVLVDPAEVVEQAVALASGSEVDTITGGKLRLAVSTICLHSDTPGAAALARAVREGLQEAGFSLAAPA